ncbi:MAG: cytidine deaminase [Oscillospiraceae bacterium]
MIKTLIEKALEAQKNAYSPYSDFCVGAALLSKDGQIFTGCNIESVSFTPTICAERTAISKAVSENVRSFTMIAIVGKKRNAPQEEINYVAPCGVCRQMLVEFCQKDFKVILAKTADDYKVYTLEELLPYSFSPLELLDNK